MACFTVQIFNFKNFIFFADDFRIEKKAFEKDGARAQCNFGKIYDQGLGIIQDYYEDVRWYSFVAKQGYPEAQNDLGTMYSKGKDVSQDYKEALR